jgi:hypothetical protein
MLIDFSILASLIGQWSSGVVQSPEHNKVQFRRRE